MRLLLVNPALMFLGPCLSTVAAFAPISGDPRTTGRIRTSTNVSRTTRTSPSSLEAQIFVDLINEYQYLSSAFPLPTDSATFGTFAGVGDAIAQKKEQTIEEKGTEEKSSSSSFDGDRTQRFILKGLGAGIIWAQWYPLVDGWSDVSSAYVLTEWLSVEDVGTAHQVAKTASSILMEQFLACPVVYSLWDIPVPALLAGTPPARIPGIVRDKVPGLLLDNAKVWTVANVIVYNLPVQWRVFAVSVAEIFWASIVSSVATSGTSAVGFIEAQDSIIDQIKDEKSGKVDALSTSSDQRK